MALKLILIATVLTKLVSHVSAQNQYFYSNPSLSPPTLVVETNNDNLTANGYIFMAPFQDAQPSPLIFDGDGTLIWDGRGFVAPLGAQDLTVCDYNASPHLCFISAAQENGYARGSGLILDPTYTQVLNVTSGNGQPGLDQHEFFVKDNGTTALVTIYKQIPFNASSYATIEPAIANVTWLQIGIFQEIELATGNVNFEWQTIDHVPVTASYVLPGTTDISGNGLSENSAWDYFHINSIDKDSNGDYLVSGRHVKTIYKISGVDGSIIWQLGGMSSDFTQDYTFDFQHFARFQNESGNTTTISLYDNGSDDAPPPAGQSKPGYEPYSAGKVVSVDTSDNSSTFLTWYVSPGKQSSNSQGDLQYLGNGNKFMGMGDLPYAVEFTDNSTGTGEVVYYAYLNNSNGNGFSSYRNFKFEWSAQPAAAPDLFVYAQDCSSSPVYYVSWNGATEVDSWVFKSSNLSTGHFHSVASVPKNGFETVTTSAGAPFSLYTIAEAIDASGNVLDQSSVVTTFVPDPSITGCSATSCGTTINYATAATENCTVTTTQSRHHPRPPSPSYVS